MTFDFITTLTYVLIDNFCPCFYIPSSFSFSILLQRDLNSCFLVIVHSYWYKFKWMLTLWRSKFSINLILILEVMEGHTKSSFYLEINFFLDFFFLWNIIFSTFSMNANITKMQIFYNIKFNFNITLTYVLMDNFCPCFYIYPAPSCIIHLVEQGFESIK